MNKISNDIYSYFCGNFTALPLDKQLHFASRLWSWQNDPVCRTFLDELRPLIIPKDDVAGALRGIHDGSLLPLRQGSSNVLSLREPYFSQYPRLRQSATVLYWAALLEHCYGIPTRTAVASVLDTSELIQLSEALFHDRQAIAILSTHAVNFLYLYRHYCQDALPDPQYFVNIVRDPQWYPTDNPLYTQLKIYSLTHVVIGESLFYRLPIPAVKMAGYRNLLRELETIMSATLTTINLDNKLEFLVCCRIADYKTTLEATILAEAADSISDDGDFLVDRHNGNQQSAYTTFDKSEHRSVLYIMATTPPEAIRLKPANLY